MSETKLAVVVPCYNPADDWHLNLIESYNEFATAIDADCELILVNDGSVKGVNEAHIDTIRRSIPDLNYISYPDNQGKGFALRRGIREVGNRSLITTDIDFPYTQDSMLRVYHSLTKNGGLILGTRKKSYYHRVPFFRKILSISFRIVIRSLFRLEVDDTQCGLKGMDVHAAQRFLKTRVNGYLFDLEFVKLISRDKISISRVNASLKPSVEFTNMSPRILLRESANLLKILRL